MAYVLLAIVLLAGCATSAPVRLSAGDCALIEQADQVIVVGSQCEVKRLYK
jgi:hypothetical protein